MLALSTEYIWQNRCPKLYESSDHASIFPNLQSRASLPQLFGDGYISLAIPTPIKLHWRGDRVSKNIWQASRQYKAGVTTLGIYVLALHSEVTIKLHCLHSIHYSNHYSYSYNIPPWSSGLRPSTKGVKFLNDTNEPLQLWIIFFPTDHRKTHKSARTIFKVGQHSLDFYSHETSSMSRNIYKSATSRAFNVVYRINPMVIEISTLVWLVVCTISWFMAMVL